MIHEWFSLDGMKCTDLGIAMLGYAIQPMPDQVVQTLEIPGMNGAYTMLPGTFKQFRAAIQCAQLSEDEIDLAGKLTRLKGWMSGKRRLMLWDREGIEYTACLAQSTNMDNQALRGEFTLTFTCDPVGQGVERAYPIGTRFLNSGNSDAPCIVTVRPESAIDGLTITHAGGSVKLFGALSPDRAVVIDGVKRYVTIGGVDGMPRTAIDVDWPVAVPGPNLVEASLPAAGDVRFRERWI